MSNQTTTDVATSDAQNHALVTFALFTYNQEKYIREAVEGAFSQTYSPLEIILSDDCSTDRTFEIIQEMAATYSGPHKLVLNRNAKNLGLIGHVNKIFELARGELIIAAAGDDVSLPDRTKWLAEAYERSGEKALVLHSNAIRIDEFDGEHGVFAPPVVVEKLSVAKMARSMGIYIGATAAWSKKLYAEFGPIVCPDAYEDLVLGFRAALHDALIYVDKPLVRYRVGIGITAKHQQTSILDFRSRIRQRVKKLKARIGVQEQRLKDLDRVDGYPQGQNMKIGLLKSTGLARKRLLFYQKPLELFSLLFTKEAVPALRAYLSESKYILGLKN